MTILNSEQLLKPTIGDLFYALSKGCISLIPGVGGPLSELVSLLVVAPATKRRDIWVESQLSEAFKLITEKADRSIIEDLHTNEVFITVVLQASSIAIRTHQREKIEALKNAIVNSVLPTAPNENLQLVFLSIIDTFTPVHLRLMDFIDSPINWCQKNDVKLDSRIVEYKSSFNESYRDEIYRDYQVFF